MSGKIIKSLFFISYFIIFKNSAFAADCSSCGADGRRYCGVYNYSERRWVSGTWEVCPQEPLPPPPPAPQPGPIPIPGGGGRPEVRCDVCTLDGQRTCRVINQAGEVTSTFTENCIPPEGSPSGSRTECGMCAYPGQRVCRVINNRGVVTAEYPQSCSLEPSLFSCSSCVNFEGPGGGWDSRVCYSVLYAGTEITKAGCYRGDLWRACEDDRKGDPRCRN